MTNADCDTCGGIPGGCPVCDGYGDWPITSIRGVTACRALDCR